MSNLKLRVGAWYLSRRGDLVKITTYQEGHPYPFAANDGRAFMEGGYYIREGAGSPEDLIEEVTVTVTPRPCLPRGRPGQVVQGPRRAHREGRGAT